MGNSHIIHLLATVTVGWAITFALRALPFIVFAGKSRKLPSWVEKAGNIISPVIIAGLILYSYASLEWRTLAPYAAGAATVCLQLLWRNPLSSIIAGTALYMVLLRTAA